MVKCCCFVILLVVFNSLDELLVMFTQPIRHLFNRFGFSFIHCLWAMKHTVRLLDLMVFSFWVEIRGWVDGGEFVNYYMIELLIIFKGFLRGFSGEIFDTS